MCFDKRLPEPAAVIHLAREFDINSILPAAFYTLMRINPVKDWGGLAEEIDNRDSPLETVADSRAARWSMLTAHDLHCLYLGQFYLLAEAAQLWSRCTTPIMGECTQEDKCSLAMEVVGKQVRWSYQGHCADVLDQHKCLISKLDDVIPQLCGSCHVKLIEEREAGRKSVWDSLPILFGLPV